jgi:hypothetical protein
VTRPPALALALLAGCVSSPRTYDTIAHSPLPQPTLRDGQPLGAPVAAVVRVGGPMIGDREVEGGRHMTIAARQGGGELRFRLGPNADLGAYVEDLGGQIVGTETPANVPEADGVLLGANLHLSIPTAAPGLRVGLWVDLAHAAVPVQVFEDGDPSEDREGASRVGLGLIASHRRGRLTGFGGVSRQQMFTGFERQLEVVGPPARQGLDHVDVRLDQPGHDDAAGGVDDLVVGGRRRVVAADLDQDAVPRRHVAGEDAGGGVDGQDRAPAQDDLGHPAHATPRRRRWRQIRARVIVRPGPTTAASPSASSSHGRAPGSSSVVPIASLANVTVASRAVAPGPRRPSGRPLV